MKAAAVAETVQAWDAERPSCLVCDGAASHRAKTVRELGLPLVMQPPAAPELNPAERVFQEVRRAVEGHMYASLAEKRTAVEGYLTPLAANRQRIYKQAGLTPVIIATEHPDNPGTSITNLAEQHCAEVLRVHLRARWEEEELVVWIEHYQRTPDELRRHWPEFDRISFHSPAPRRVTVAGRERLQLKTPSGPTSRAPPSKRWSVSPSLRSLVRNARRSRAEAT